MANILLVEPNYRSKFPPLGLMRISTFHKGQGDAVTFVRGTDPAMRSVSWDRIYVSSLFTFELPRTVRTIKYYRTSVNSDKDIYVGGIAATLKPDYIRNYVDCSLIVGPLDKPGMLGGDMKPVASLVPDYDILRMVNYRYEPEDTYFCRITVGCIRNCAYCAVPTLEPVYGLGSSIHQQIEEVRTRFGEKQHLVLMDNNFLAIEGLVDIIEQIKDEGFAAGATRNKKRRTVDFNQGLDARLVTPEVAKILSGINLSPVRFAFDYDAMEGPYRRAITLMADAGFREFTSYVMFNFSDDPFSFYRRLRVNLELSQELGVLVTGFPMRYIPISDDNRRHIGKHWNWRFLRGIQCVLLATHGVVSPNPAFFEAAFGRTYDEFREILAMPDLYIIYRNRYREQADEWRRAYRQLSDEERNDFLVLLERLNGRDLKTKRQMMLAAGSKYRDLLWHYYPEVFDPTIVQETLNV
ncbi:MAG TPA: cobalamin-binding domain-containing protein [Firmicutes bacterium]|nr:cobalamin-binding domain-containing protein [Bacillota bacterium]